MTIDGSTSYYYSSHALMFNSGTQSLTITLTSSLLECSCMTLLLIQVRHLLQTILAYVYRWIRPDLLSEKQRVKLWGFFQLTLVMSTTISFSISKGEQTVKMVKKGLESTCTPSIPNPTCVQHSWQSIAVHMLRFDLVSWNITQIKGQTWFTLKPLWFVPLIKA